METVETIGAGQEPPASGEVDPLLAPAATAGQTTPEAPVAAHAVALHRGTSPAQRHDFRNPVFLAAPELRKLRSHHEEFVRAVATRLSISLRTEFTLQVSQFSAVTYQKFTEMLPNPAHVVLFTAEPLRGICLFSLKQKMGLAIVDRMMGGPGSAVAEDRDLSEIETALMEQVVQLFLDEWCSHWGRLMSVRPALLGHETNPRFLNTAQPDSTMVALTLDAQLGESFGQLHLGFPYAALEPLIRLLDTRLEPPNHAVAIPKPTGPAWNPELDDVKVPVTAEFPGMPMSVRRLTSLQVGDLIELDGDMPGRVRLRLANLPKFNGRLGTRSGKWAIEISQILKPVTQSSSRS